MAKHKNIYFLLTTIFLLMTIALPTVLFSINTPLLIIVISEVIVSIFFIFGYYLLFVRPVKQIETVLAKAIKGDFSSKCKDSISCITISPYGIIADKIDELSENTLNKLILNLKMEILHTQDSADEFLSEVQKSLTNSTRISLGTDYIESRVVNLESLLSDSINENNETKTKISEYEQLVSKQMESINSTGNLLQDISLSLDDSISMLAKKKGASEQVSDTTKQCSEKVNKTVEAVSKISEAIGLVKDTIKIVASVASRTNLLAMNAAIEAAHAGAAGAGFAVVADEIRSLAETTSNQVKSITSSLKGVTQIIEETVEIGGSTGTAFAEITEQVENFIKVFDEVIDYYYNLDKKNKSIVSNFSQVQNIASDISSEMSTIKNSIEYNIDHLHQIEKCNEEIRGIVKRNNSEAVTLGHSQAPIYKNVIKNSKMMEAIRKQIDIFRFSTSQPDVWKADKSELHKLIEAMFCHLDWTVMLFDYIHGESTDIIPFFNKGTSLFDKWFYETAKNAYKELPIIKRIEQIDVIINEKAKLIQKLKDAGKEHEATIEFSEVIDRSRVMIQDLNEIKRYIIETWRTEKQEKNDLNKSFSKKNNVTNSMPNSEQTLNSTEILSSLKTTTIEQPDEIISDIGVIDAFEQLEAEKNIELIDSKSTMNINTNGDSTNAIEDIESVEELIDIDALFDDIEEYK